MDQLLVIIRKQNCKENMIKKEAHFFISILKICLEFFL